jgi:hypothetical protein
MWHLSIFSRTQHYIRYILGEAIPTERLKPGATLPMAVARLERAEVFALPVLGPSLHNLLLD